MNKYTWLTIILLFTACHVFAQDILIDETIAAPTNEIYDLLQDSRGFIWVADELGVRRYDGVSFISYTHHLQSSLSMTDLAEDKQGRIWCHNFSGQIFYIEQEQMHLLEAYKGTEEKYFPRIAICGDELLATTSRGLFTCNTRTLQCKYLTSPVLSTTSLCIVNNKAVLHGDSAWYVYREDEGIAKMQLSKTTLAQLPSNNNLTLQPTSKGDTVYALSNPTALLFTFTFTNQQLTLQHVEQCNSFINSVTVEHGETWMHTKAESRSLSSGQRIQGFNLSCMLKDKDGNTWCGSLEEGLMLSYARPPWHIIKTSDLALDK